MIRDHSFLNSLSYMNPHPSRQEKILILLATHNGEKYLPQQLESIANQSLKSWELYIRDDASDDRTVEIITEWAAGMEKGQVRLQSSKESTPVGALANFAALCKWALRSDAQYYCFCDQDDYWHPDKLEIMLDRIAQIGSRYASEVPVLVHCDLQVVDRSREILSQSFMSYQGLPDPLTHSLSKLLIQNNVTGCASMFNRALLELATPVPDNILIHDWWFALCAESTGHIGFIEQPLIDYRQHGDNLVGARARNISRNPLKREFYKIALSFPRHLKHSMLQNKLLLKRIRERDFKSPKLDVLESYSKLGFRRYHERVKILNAMLNVRHEILVLLYLIIISLFRPEKKMET